MSVIINDFEVVAEPPPALVEDEPAAKPQPRLGGEDVYRLLRRRLERLARVAAH